MSEFLNQSLMITLVGIVITFGVLYLLVLFISAIKWADHKWEEREEGEKEKALSDQQTMDNTTLVLISAAVATYFKGRAVIRRVRVLPKNPKRGGNWATQARTVLQSSHVTKK
ncbi:MAG: OadG family protein [Deferribacterales bacterium]|nr:OadG family protein [Deferribacterales bacterium]